MRRIFHQLRILLHDIRGARRITSDQRSYRRLATDFVLSKLMRLMGKTRLPQQRTVRLRDKTVLHYRLDRADIYTIHEVWMAQEYQLPSGILADTVIDIGANIGLTSVWLSKRCQAKRVLAVEPSPENVRLLRMNLSSNVAQHEIFEAAAGACDGSAIFDSGPGSTNGRLIENDGEASSQQSTVPVVSMATVMDSLPEGAPADLVKIDIEGGEQDLLSSNLEWLQRVNALLVEFHAALCDYQQLTSNLEKAGFRRVSSVCSDPAMGNTVEFFQRSN